MPKRIAGLTDAKVKTAKAMEKPVKLFDGDGLFLLVTPEGGKCWRLKYRMAGKEKILALGVYPAVSLAVARKRRDAAREQVAQGVDPGQVRKDERAALEAQRANTFEKLAREWLSRQGGTLAEKTRNMILQRLVRDAFSQIGAVPVAELSARLILEQVLRPLEDRGVIETAHRVRGVISQILRYAVAIGAAERDVTVDLRGALPPIPRRHMSAVTEPAKVGELLRAIDGYDGSLIVKCALRLLPMVATRPGELRLAEWSELDIERAEWNIPAGRMKMRQPHLVPLPQQALAVLDELRRLTGSGRYLFPSVRSTARPISDNTMNAALRRMGYGADEMVSHGWRAVFRTLADEVLQERIYIVEAALAHQVKDALGRSYNRTSFLKERRALAQRWADYLDGLKAGAKVIPLRAISG